jgi:hypothetical protein
VTDRYCIYRGGRNNTYDYDIFSPATWAFDEYNGSGSYQTLADFQNATTQEDHGLQAAITINSNGTLPSGSVAIDKGTPLANHSYKLRYL